MKPPVKYTLLYDCEIDALTPWADEWERAIGDEITSLYKYRQCWEYVPYDKSSTALSNFNFVFTVMSGHMRRKGLIIASILFLLSSISRCAYSSL